MLNLIISFDSALAYWSSASACKPQRYLTCDEAAKVLQSSRCDSWTNVLQTMDEISWISAFEEPIDLLIPAAADRHIHQKANLHCWQTQVPAGAFVPLGPSCWSVGGQLCNIVMSSPEFCFLQMAQVMDDYELIELGFELCGTYAINPTADRGVGERAAVTTPKRLAAFCEKATGAPGVQRARRAAKWVLAGSHSPKESQVAMFATLSRSRGGCGLPAPLLNSEFPLAPHIARVVGAPSIVPDKYWKRIKTVLEYDSRDWHDGYEASEHDARKRTAYRLLGLNVVTVTKSQFEELETMSMLFEDLARQFRLVRRPASERQQQARAKLHNYLVRARRRERQVFSAEPGKFPLPQLGADFDIEIPWGD